MYWSSLTLLILLMLNITYSLPYVQTSSLYYPFYLLKKNWADASSAQQSDIIMGKHTESTLVFICPFYFVTEKRNKPNSSDSKCWYIGQLSYFCYYYIYNYFLLSAPFTFLLQNLFFFFLFLLQLFCWKNWFQFLSQVSHKINTDYTSIKKYYLRSTDKIL